MGATSNLRTKFEFALVDFLRGAKEKTTDVGKRILRPRVFEKWTDGPEDRLMQVLSLLLVPMVIVVSLVVIVAINETLAGLFGVSEYNETQEGIVGWFITGMTAGFFILAAWAWFQFVRTYGFGIFRW